MRIVFPAIIFFLAVGQSCFSQRRNVSMMDGNQMFSYTITRYSPAWEIQSGVSEENEPVLSENSKLFRKLEDSNVNNLKNLLYAKGFVPNEVESQQKTCQAKQLQDLSNCQPKPQAEYDPSFLLMGLKAAKANL